MARRLISTGSKWEQEVGYSRVVVDGEWAFVSGTTGFDYATMTISPDVGEQARQALENIASALRGAGFSLADVVRTVYILPRGGLPRLLAGPARILRRDPAGEHCVDRRPRRSADAHRDRGHGAARRMTRVHIRACVAGGKFPASGVVGPT